jgi:anti-anti-sigma factor
MPEPLRIDVTTVRGSLMVAAFHGELDMTGVEAADDALEQAAHARPRILVVSLEGLDFMDSSGATVLIRARRRAVEAGHRLVVLNGSGHPHRVLTLLGLTSHFDMIDDLAALDEAASRPARRATGP